MIQEQKILLGSMDKNNSPESLNIYDYLDAHNIRTVGNSESEANYVTNLEGTELITVNLPQGQNKCIGSKGFENISKAYFIRYNSMGYHQIIEFDFDTKMERILFENLSDSGDSDILNWTANTYFTDIRIVHDNFLILNNGVNPIYCLDLELLKEQKGNKIINEDDFSLIKIPPHTPATSEYYNNQLITTNGLRGNLYQFRYQYEYVDGRTSVWSTVSERTVPEDEASDGQGQNVMINNVLAISLDIGTPEVSKINIAVRENLGNWLLIKEVDRDYVENLPPLPNTIPNGDVQEYYNQINNNYVFGFYNDGLYPIIDPIEVGSQYDHVPHQSETVEVINGNILALGGITEGYDRPQLDLFSTSVTYYLPDLKTNVNSSQTNNNLRTNGIYWNDRSTGIFEQDFKGYWDVFFTGEPVSGDVIRLRYNYNTQPSTITVSYNVTAQDEIDGLNITISRAVNYFSGVLPYPLYIEYILFQGQPHFRIWSQADNPTPRLYSVDVQNQNIGSLSTKSISSLKNGASYQLAYAAYDKYGRFFPIVTDDRFVIHTDSLSKSRGELPLISWNITEEAPEGAVGYRILMSENRTFQKYITLTGVLESGNVDGDYLVFNLKSLDRFNEFEKDSQVTYDFTKGDKVTFIKFINGTGETVRWVIAPYVELDIVSFDIVPNTQDNTVSYLLKVRSTSILSTYNSELQNTNLELEMEIYTPKSVPQAPDREFFYEIGNDYKIIDGKHTVTSDEISIGDSYFRGRLYRSSITESGIGLNIADPNFSDNYESNFWSAGRARFYDDEEGRVEKKGSIRYSDEYIYGSRYNGIGRFYAERIYGESGGQTTSKHGWIRKLESRDNAVVCVQEFKVGVIPNYKTIVYDNTDASLVADSGRIFGSIQYRVGNYGIGNAKESFSVSNDGVMYFLDDNHCVPLRDSLSGLDVIDRNMTKHFVTYVKEAKDRGAKFIGVYDNFYKEWNLTVEDVSGRLITINISDDNIIYRDSFIPPLNTLNLLQPSNGTVSISGSMITYTPNQDYVGGDQISVEFPTPNGIEQKYIDVEVVEGDSTPNPFNFTTQLNRQLNTLVTSNQIVVSGITMPSPISIATGEYQVNGGVWVSSVGTVVDGDTVRVRHTTSNQYETDTVTTLTIGGVVGTFTSTTVEEQTAPDNWTVVGTVRKEFSEIHVNLELSEAISENYEVYCVINYTAFGSNQQTPPIRLQVPSGQTVSDINTGFFIGDGSISYGELLLDTSSIPNNTLITPLDGIQRVVDIQRLMFVE